MMREQWKFLGLTESGKSIGVGCPQFMRGRQELKFSIADKRLKQIESACSVWHRSRIDFSTSSDSTCHYRSYATHASLSHPDDIEQV